MGRNWFDRPTIKDLEDRYIVEDDKVVDCIGHIHMVPIKKGIKLVCWNSGTYFIGDIIPTEEIDGLIEALQECKKMIKENK